MSVSDLSDYEIKLGVWLAEIDGQSRTMDDDQIFIYSSETHSVSALRYQLVGDAVAPSAIEIDEPEWTAEKAELVAELERRGLERYD